MKRDAILLSLIAVGALAAAPARAEVQRIAADGTVYRVDVDTYNGSGKPSGTVLRTTRQRPRGGKDTFVVTGTDDAVVDRDPALEIDPATGKPVLVWSRNEGGSFNLFFSRFDTAWSAPQMLLRFDGDELEPQIHLGDEYLHVTWRQSVGNSSAYWRASFDPATLQRLFGPERLPVDDATPIPPEGGPEPATAPTDSQYFCTSTLGRTMADPSRAYIWGVRDEPVPVGYHQSFVLPCDIHVINSQNAAFVGGRLTLWITTPNLVYYTTLANGRWADIRVVEITPQTSASDARLLIEDINNSLGGH
ncbi:MAG TPA: hypothetical protein VFV19_04020 [Candidatus Polarisedimenticolaceae bacterium]|nr:hypothetical protein [Candidatus Polarisedimenticolaceae bacterium]